jgi:hypothetical protein
VDPAALSHAPAAALATLRAMMLLAAPIPRLKIQDLSCRRAVVLRHGGHRLATGHRKCKSSGAASYRCCTVAMIEAYSFIVLYSRLKDALMRQLWFPTRRIPYCLYIRFFP